MSFRDFTSLFNKKLVEIPSQVDVRPNNATEHSQTNDIAGSIFDVSENDYDINESIENLQDEFADLFNFFKNLKENKQTEEVVINKEKTIDEIVQNASTGEAFEIPGEHFAYIKTGDGEYEKLNISIDTYNELFSGEPQTATGLKGLLKGKENHQFNDFSQIYNNENSRYYFLNCFSEDGNGNITVTIPSTSYSFTFNKQNNYGDFGFIDGTDIGIQMMSTAYNAMWQEEKIPQLEEEALFWNFLLEEESQNYSEEFNAQINEIYQYANENKVSTSYIFRAFDIFQNGGNLEDYPKVFNDEELNSLLKELPQDELKNLNSETLFDYLSILNNKYSFENALKNLTENPIGTVNMNDYYDNAHILSSLGLDINGDPISSEAIELAQDFIEYYECPISSEFNENYIAAYLNNNPYGEEILNAIMQNEELKYVPTDITILLEESLKEDADIDYILKAAGLGWHLSFFFDNSFINPENIDLAILFNETYGDEKDVIDFREIGIASQYLDNEILEKSIIDGTYTNLHQVNEYLEDIIPNYQDDGTTRSELLKKDIELLYTSAIEGIPIEDLVIPTNTNIQEGLQNSEIGDIFEVDGEDYIYIKTSNGEYEQLQISKEAYMELFPPVQRYMSSQGQIGDCYLVSSLNNMMTDPTTRHLLLQCFSEDENGNITVDLPNGDYTFTIERGKEVIDYLPEYTVLEQFATGEEYSISSEFALSDSSLGMQMLELCYGIYLKDEAISSEMDKLTSLYGEMSIEEKEAAETIIDYINENTDNNDNSDFGNNLELILIFNDLESTTDSEEQDAIISHLEMLFFSEPNDEFRTMLTDYISNGYAPYGIPLLMRADTYLKNIQELQDDTYGSKIRGSGGYIDKVFETFGIECISYRPSSTQPISELLENPNIRIIAGGTRGDNDSTYLNRELNIAGRHAYTIYPIQQENGEWLFEVINPWDESQTSILTEAQINEYFSHIEYIETDTISYKQAPSN